MNIMNELTKKHMLTHKKRTIMTIIGVIISVAMITAVATASTTFISLFQRREIAENGAWHVRMNNINQSQKDNLEELDNLKYVYYSSDIGYGSMIDKVSENPNKPYIYVMSIDKLAQKYMSIQLLDGRYPTNSNEVVISSHLLSNGKVDYKLGDILELELGERYVDEYKKENILTQDNPLYIEVNEKFHGIEKKSYTIVGIMDRHNMEPYSAAGYTAFTYMDEAITQYDEMKYNAYLFLDKVNDKIYETYDTFVAENGISREQISYHNRLLVYYGISQYDGVNAVIQGLAIILILIIMIGSVSLIYNSFAISITERSKQFGMLASVGATRRQKRNAIFYEGAMIGVIAIPLGILAGIGGMWVTFRIVGPMLVSSIGFNVPLIMIISPSSIIVAIVFSMATILLSAYSPAKRASNISPLDAIRQNNDIKEVRRKKKIRHYESKIYGIEGALAIKNLNRHKKRFNTLVFSLAISLILFITVGSYVFFLSKTLLMTNSSYNYDIALSTYNEEEESTLFQELSELKEVKDIIQVRYLSFALFMKEESVEQHITKEFKELFYKEYTNYGYSIDELDERWNATVEDYIIQVISLDDISYKKYVDTLGVSIEDSTNRIEGIFLNKRATASNVDKMEADVFDIKEGDVISVNHNYKLYGDGDNGSESILVDTKEFNIHVKAATDKLPLGFTHNSVTGPYQIIMSESKVNEINEAINMMYEQEDNNRNIRYYMNIKNGEEIEKNIKTLVLNNRVDEYHYMDQYNSSQKEKQMLTVFSVFAYGFITLISLICVTNLCNTISTSFSLRRREFAMLKSVGMTQSSFLKMIYLESVMYGVKALAFGLPISLYITYKIYDVLGYNFKFQFEFPIVTYLVGILFILFVVGIAIIYSSSKVKNESIIGGLKSEIQ